MSIQNIVRAAVARVIFACRVLCGRPIEVRIVIRGDFVIHTIAVEMENDFCVPMSPRVTIVPTPSPWRT